MTTISARIEADSISPSGQRITTMSLKYPRFIHAEFMTHRVFSRNASSSRAIPVKRMIESIREDMAMPVRWGVNKPGMQDGGELSHVEQEVVGEVWINACEDAIRNAQRLLNMPNQPHKQVVNRLLEPFMHITVLVTATNYSNWFALRNHKDADPTIQKLAEVMQGTFDRAEKPVELAHGDWHLPFITEDTVNDACLWVSENPQAANEDVDYATQVEAVCRQVSAARCARVSYNNHDGTAPDINSDMLLFQRLMGNIVKHASPTEHQATPDTYLTGHGFMWPKLHGNLNGWIQHRKLLDDEFIGDVQLEILRKNGEL